MVRFYTLLNIELVIVVGPQAIAEICLAKADGFTHSQEGELLIAGALGHAGLFRARGGTHKVSSTFGSDEILSTVDEPSGLR
jgi:hypothetical protein